jgi:hypothetical protein
MLRVYAPRPGVCPAHWGHQGPGGTLGPTLAGIGVQGCVGVCAGV